MDYQFSSGMKERLVKVKPGDYPVVSGRSRSSTLNVKKSSPGLLVKYVGEHIKSKTPCWHVLVNENIVLAWEDSFEVERKC